MTDNPTPTPPREPLRLPPNCREVPGVPFAIIGAEHLRQAPAPSPAPAPPEGAKPPTERD